MWAAKPPRSEKESTSPASNLIGVPLARRRMKGRDHMRKKQLTAVLGTAAVLSLVAGLASAHGGDADRVHACVGSNGDVRILGASDDCKANETALDWAIQGPRGETGPQGPQGIQGLSAAISEPNQNVIGRLSIAGVSGGDGGGDGSIDVRGIEGGVTNSGTFAGGGGGGAGKASFSDITVTKQVDKASPVLAMAVAQGTHFASATLDVFQPGTTDVYMTYHMEDVIVSEHHMFATGKGDTVPLESLSLHFAEISWTFIQEDGSEVTRCYSVTRIMAC
jgi:type VI secretion system secreted protein Hcp